MRRGAECGWRVRIAALVLAGLAELAGFAGARAQDLAAAPPVAAAIEHLLAAGNLPDLPAPRLADVAADLHSLYPTGASLPLWSDAGGPTAAASGAVDALAAASSSGLDPDDYAPLRLRTAVRGEHRAWEDPDRAWFDVALSASLLRYAAALHHGRIAFSKRDFDLTTSARPLLDGALVVRQIAAGADAASTLAGLEPSLSLYRDLEKALPRYRSLADQAASLPPLGDLGTLHPGDTGVDLSGLRAFLLLVGDLAPGASPAETPADLYDPALIDAVKHFQMRHGLDTDGVVGAQTKRALAVPLRRRVAQIEWNLERLRWLPRVAGPLIVVNIPEFRLRAYRDPQTVADLSMKVIVGSAARKHYTVAFASALRGVAFWPPWNVPRSITRNEMLARIETDPGYLARENLEIVAPFADGGSRILGASPGAMAALRSGTARLRQRPGAHNSLGRIKFLMPNSYNIYLHDTPSVRLFDHSRRDFSHGCVRVAGAVDLAEFVLAGTDDWDCEHIDAALAAQRTRHVVLSRPIPVWIHYLTAVASPTGEVSFFNDLYERDEALAAHLR